MDLRQVQKKVEWTRTGHNTVHISLRGFSVALWFLFLNLVRSRGTILQQVALVMADGHLTSAPNPATQYAPTLGAICYDDTQRLRKGN